MTALLIVAITLGMTILLLVEHILTRDEEEDNASHNRLMREIRRHNPNED